MAHGMERKKKSDWRDWNGPQTTLSIQLKLHTCVNFHTYPLFCQDGSDCGKNNLKELPSFINAHMKSTDANRHRFNEFLPPKWRRGSRNKCRPFCRIFRQSRPRDHYGTLLLGLFIVGCNEPQIQKNLTL